MSNFTTMTDFELVGLYEKGNDRAFDELLKRHQQHLFAYILCVVGDENLANDVFQDTFIKAITNIRTHKYADTGRFSAWLMRIAHNVIVDHTRNPRNMPHLSEDQEKMLCNNSDLSVGSCEEDLLEDSDNQMVAALIARLPREQQEIVHLRYFEDLSFKEISAITGVGINTCLGRMHYAMGNLRHLLSQYDLDIAV